MGAMTHPSREPVTREEFNAAHQAGLDSSPLDRLPKGYVGTILAATWRSGHDKAIAERRAKIMAERLAGERNTD